MSVKIDYEMVDDFNEKIDKVISDLRYQATSPSANREMRERYIDISNRMEITRRVFNHYAETGEVVVPD